MGNFCSTSISCDAFISRCLDCTINKAAYISALEENLDTVETELQKLIAAKNDVMRRVAIAEQQQMRRTEQVKEWLSRVQDMEAQVGELQRVKPQHIENLCLGGYCSKSCRSSYQFGKEVAEKLQDLTTMKREGNEFKEVAERVPEDPADKMPIDQPKIVGQQSLFDEVWKHLEKKEVGVIGLYGPGGVGKTTLLKQINNKFCQEKHQFDYIIWVVVSKEVNYEKLEEEIGKKIGLFSEAWKEKSLADKAKDIFKVLSKKKFVLLLDDIWKRIDLSEIGVPLPSLENESKIILTTRFLDVCGQMKVDKSIKVKALRPDQAWELFQENLQKDIIYSHPGIPQLARSVADECGGIPLVLIVIGRAMACKDTLEEWQDAVEVLRRSIFEFQGMSEEYRRLKFSYDNLPDEKTRSCFLYCCLYPEDTWIRKNWLIDYWIGEGFLDEYNRGYSIIGDLVRACLLEEENNYVKMHDVVRDMALWITREIEKECFLVHADANLTEAPEVGKWEGMKRISLMGNKIKNLTETPTCPHLVTLLLRLNLINTIASDFFWFMPSLMVLDLSRNHDLTTLPSGFSRLASLQFLNLAWTGIRQLPQELKELVNLTCLDLNFTFHLHTIPPQLISSFSKLQVLKMINCGTAEGAPEHSIFYGGSELWIKELLHLKHLSRLNISLRSSLALQTFLGSHKFYSCTQSFHLQNVEDVESLEVSSLAAMKHLEFLNLEGFDLTELKINCEGVIQKVQEVHCLNSLRVVDIWYCSRLREVTWLVFAPCLERLVIAYCPDMEEIVDPRKMGEAYKEIIQHLNPFAKLKNLRLDGLQNLKSISRDALSFSQMKQMYIRRCPKLNSLPLDSKCSEDHKFEIRGEEEWWKELQWKDEATLIAFLPFFKSC